MSSTKAKTTLEEYLTYGGFGRVETEVRFHPERKWQADYLLPDQNPPVIVEYDGLMHHGSNQGHASITKIMRDQEKGNAAQALGYRFLRANAKSITDGSFFRILDTVLTKQEQST